MHPSTMQGSLLKGVPQKHRTNATAGILSNNYLVEMLVRSANWGGGGWGWGCFLEGGRNYRAY